MDETKFDWSDLKLFLAVARGGGLAAGAKMSGQSAPTLGRHITNLERALGKELFVRLAQGYTLTDAGELLLEMALGVEARVLDIVRFHDNQSSVLPIRISAGTWMTWFLARNISAFSSSKSVLMFSATEAMHNIGRREALIGIRNKRPNDQSLAIRRTTSVDFCPYVRKDRVNVDNWIGSMVETASSKWVTANHGEKITFQVNHPRLLLDMVLEGAGQAVLPCFVGDVHENLIRSGDVIDALTHEQWLIVHGEERHLPHVRETVDTIYDLIKSASKVFGPT